MRSSIMAMGWADGPWKVSLNWQLICLPDDPIGENDFLRVIPTLTHYSHTTWKCVYIYNILFHYINSIFAYIYIYIYIMIFFLASTLTFYHSIWYSVWHSPQHPGRDLEFRSSYGPGRVWSWQRRWWLEKEAEVEEKEWRRSCTFVKT